ncbi:NAB [Mytilus coruscus]|uniref:NAB n=1 Tax=Mytilus coruscus TaxID=42192 RepID=A0A6J7ZX73_MYTCO|nr:NAB [Mytilus coruscus]
MATNQPQNVLEWQLHCVLKRANLLQYYDSFIRQGECDVLQLSETDDLKFKDVMQKVGMAKKSIHVRQFKNTLLEWVKDPGEDAHVPNYIKEDDDSRMPPAPRSLNPRTATLPLPDKSSVVQQLPKSTQGNQTKEKDELRSSESEKKEFPNQQYTTQQQKHSDVKGKNSRVPSYIKEDDDSRMPPASRSLNPRTVTPPLPDNSSVVQQLPKSTHGNQTKEKDDLTSSVRL